MILFDRDTWHEVAETIGRNKRRSIVTAFGVFWGIFMLIILLSLSNGFRNGIKLATDGVATSMVGLDRQSTSVAYDGLPAGRSWNMTHGDVEQIVSLVPEIKSSGTSYTLWNDATGIMAEGKKDDAVISAIDAGYFDILYVRLLMGRMLRSADHQDKRKYCLLGKSVASKLFGGNEQALGKSIRCRFGNYTVVGVVDQQSTLFNVGPSVHRSVYIPYATIEQSVQPSGVVGAVMFSFHDGADRKAAMQKIERIIKAMKRIAPEDKKAVTFFDIEEILRVFEGITLALNILVWIVGIGTLLTGIVGISNILLVTVRERTQEIGVRRALGAKPWDIITQMLMESVSLTLLAGLLGIVSGVGIMSVVAQAFVGAEDVPFTDPTVDLGLVLLALLIIIIGGLVAGLIPAFKAVEVKAIEAIREE